MKALEIALVIVLALGDMTVLAIWLRLGWYKLGRTGTAEGFMLFILPIAYTGVMVSIGAILTHA